MVIGYREKILAKEFRSVARNKAYIVVQEINTTPMASRLGPSVATGGQRNTAGLRVCRIVRLTRILGDWL